MTPYKAETISYLFFDQGETVMARESKSRFRSNITVLSAIALFCVAGFAVSRVVSSNSPNAPATNGTGTPMPKRTDLRSKGSSKPPVSSNTLTALPGRMIFGSGGFGWFNLMSVTDIGSQNNFNYLTGTNEHDPIFSPDGNRVLFRSYRGGDGGSGEHELYTMKPDGYDQTRLTTGSGYISSYAYSPDSNTIAYTSDYNLWKINADGSGSVLLADLENNIENPQFSPDGTKIMFIYNGQIWQMDTDGSNQINLGMSNYTERARFSPDGTKIVFSANDEIYTINVDGTNEVRIIDDDDVQYSLDIPEFSPDGTKLLMECRGFAANLGSNSGINICTSNADGTGFAPVPGTILERQSPVWSPDSSAIGFIARNSATNEYGVYTAVLGQQPQIVYQESTGTILHYLAWQPDCTLIPNGSPTPTPTPSYTPIPGLISEWNANNFTADDSQGLNNGQFTDGAALIQPGKRGLGFYFAGDGGYINVPDSNSLDVQTGDYTLSTWFNPLGSAEHYIAGKGACDGGGSNFYIGVDTNYDPFIDISHEAGGSRVGVGGHTLTPFVWHHLLLRKEGTVFSFYIDDVLAFNHTENGTMGVNDRPFTLGKGIGCTPPQLTTHGGVDEVLLFGRALNNAEIDAIFDGYYPPTGPTPTPTPNAGLVAFWRANGDADDTAGTNHGTLEGDTTFSTGHQGQAFDFDGSGDRVRIPDGGSDVLDVQTGEFTIAAWVYIRTSGVHFIAGKDFDDGSYAISVDGQKLYFYLINNGNYQYINTGDDLSFNTWHHVAGVRAGGQIKVFIDGTERSSTSYTENLPATSTDFTIGGPVYGTSPQPDTNGLIDDVRLYSRGLDETELTAIFNDTGFAPVHNIGSRQVTGRTNLVCQPHADPSVNLRVNYPNPVAAGRTTELGLRLKDPAPPGGALVNLSYSDSGVVNGPSSVTVPEGNAFYNFNVNTTDGTTFRNGDVIATLGAETAKVTVTVAPAAPDVAVSNLAAPATMEILQNYTATWTVTNNGQAATESYRQDTFFLSPDDQLFNDANDKIVGYSYDNSGILAPGQSKNMTFNNVNIPSAAAPVSGIYYLFVLIGDAGTVRERGGNFTDNFMSIPVQVNRNLPDLIAENIVVPAEVEPGVDFTVSWDIRNAGTRATTTGFSVNAYISFDGTVGGGDDIPVTYRVSPALAINGVSSFSQQLSIPTLPVRPSSDALLYIRVDEGNVVFEGETAEPAEQNNTPTQAFRFEYRVPDIQVQSVTPPIEVESDTAFDLAWTTKNFGLRTAGAMNERVYFSTDQIVNGNDVEIGSFALAQSLAPDQSIDRIQSVLIPTNSITATGDYYVYVKTDADGAVNEGGNENNNVTFHTIRVRRLLRPDLQVTNITAPATAFFGQEIQVQWTTANNGSGPTNTPNWQDDLYIGPGQTLSGATLLSTLSNVSFLSAGESYIASATVRIPRGLNGSFYLIARTDKGSVVNEENENNNLLTKFITINIPPLPDLGVSNVQAPGQAFGGQPISVSWTVNNNGNGPVPGSESLWYDAIYLSRNNIFDGGDRFIGSRQRTGVLAAAASYTVSNFSVDLPGDAFGDYYVFVVADYAGQVYEFTAENNNSGYDQIDPGSPMHVLGTPPDLDVLDPITAPANELAGRTINVQFAVRNQGAFDATGQWFDAVYLSTDATFNQFTDTQIGSKVRTNLTAGQQYVNSLDVTLPNCLNGTYYLFGVTDINGQIFEFDANGDAEANNVSAPKAIDITSFAPDLRVTNITIPPVVINGAMPMSWTVKNFGTAATTQTSWTDRVYLYYQNQLIVLGTDDHQGALAINGEYTTNKVVYIPLYLEGEFTIFVRTDAYNLVPECSFDENNDASGITQVGQDLPDLRITAANSPPSAPLGGSINVSWTGANQGSPMSQASNWVDMVYLSSDATYSYGDLQLGGVVKSAQLGQNQTYNANTTVSIPNIPAGNYYIIVNADNWNGVTEGVNENNNSSTAIPISITTPDVDLNVSNVSANPVLYSGQYADVSWTVNNIGQSPTVSAGWTDHVILSRDLVIDPSDRLLEYRPHSGALSGGANYTETRSIAFPAGLTGEYKIFVISDKNNNVAEANENNNISAPLTVDLQLPPPAELNITNITVPPALSLGDAAGIEWTVQNSSANTSSGVWQDSVYLSADQTWDSGDFLIGQKQRSGSLVGFATYTETLTTAVPPVELGTYYVIVRTDSRNNIRESVETNNVTASAGQTIVSVPNLTLGQALNTSLITGQERFYSIFNTPADETMLVTLTGQGGSRNELYTKYGSMVSRSNYQYQGTDQGGANQENAVLNTSAGSYYTMARADFVPGSFSGDLKKADAQKANAPAAPQAQDVTIKAEILPFSIRRITPASAGNEGLATLVVEGAKFQTGATLKLVAANNDEIVPTNLEVGNARIAAIFDLKGKPAGIYDVVVRNPNNQSVMLEDGFQIINGGGYVLGTSIIAPAETRGGRTRLLFSARNDGLNDALNVPIIVKMPDVYDYDLDRGNFIDFPTADLPPGQDPSQIPMHFDHEGSRYIMLYAPILRSRSQVNVGIDIDIPFTFSGLNIEVQVLPPLAEFADSLGEQVETQPYGPNLAPNVSDAAKKCFIELFRQIFFAVLDQILPADCLKAAWKLGASSVDLVSNMMLRNATGNAPSGLDLVSIFASKFLNNALLLAECAGKSLPVYKILAAIVTLIQLLDQLDTCLGELNSKWSIKRPRSIDPNEKIAPLGFGPEQYVPAGEPMQYRINFENLSTAAAPAQKIRIVDQLPATLDPRTMRLKEIGFKQYRVVVPENRAFYQTRLHLGADLNNLDANITAGLDITTGTVTWDLTAIDPSTNEQPLSPSVGILPPNNTDHDGEGYVIFTVEPTDGQATRTILANSATIYFDENEPIVTNTTSNMLDSTKPTSSVSALPPSTDDPNISLNWSGSDDPTDSGLKSYDVYFSENGKAYIPYLIGTTETSATFAGNFGRNYRFYSIANDNAGNSEDPPVVHDATITVLGGAFEGDVASRPNGDNDGTVNAQDIDQIRRFAAKLDADFQYNEFQRADVSPLADGGDGSLSVADVVQTSRFSSGADAVRSNAGPLTAAPLAGKTIMGKEGNLLPRSIRPAVVTRTATKIVIGVLLEAQGDETGVGFTLNYNVANLSNPTNITVGSGASGAVLTSNTSQAGKVGIILDKLPTQPFPAGTRQIVTIEFDVSPTAAVSTPITFNSDVVKNEIVNGAATGLTATFDGASIVLLPPTASLVPIAGRVVSSTGKPVKDTIVYLTDDAGFVRRTATNTAGTYRFTDIEAGRTYILMVRNKSFRFAQPTKVINLTDAVEDADFVTIE